MPVWNRRSTFHVSFVTSHGYQRLGPPGMTITDRIRDSGRPAPLDRRPLAAVKSSGAAGVEHRAVAKGRLSGLRQTGHFLRHYLEMCAPMCIGFAVGDLVYFWAAQRFGYSEPFTELPEVSVLVVTVTMTAPMTAWMLFRGMPRRATVEMSAVMPVLAIALLTLGWLTIVSRSDLALLEHGLMMPAMLVPMFFRLDLYTGRTGHAAHAPNSHWSRFRQ